MKSKIEYVRFSQPTIKKLVTVTLTTCETQTLPKIRKLFSVFSNTQTFNVSGFFRYAMKVISIALLRLALFLFVALTVWLCRFFVSEK